MHRLLAAVALMLGSAAVLGGVVASEEAPHWCSVEGAGADVAAIHDALLAEPAASASSSGEPAVVDILFVYSRKTRERHGDKLSERVRWLVDGANIIFERSSANMRLRQVGLIRASSEVNRLEAAGGFGVWGVIQRSDLWERYGADLVYGLIGYESAFYACGQASVPFSLEELRSGYSDAGAGTRQPLGMGIMQPGCLRPQTLAHEVGHNLTLLHEEQDKRLDHLEPLFRGGRGFRGTLPNGRIYGTVMAVGNAGIPRSLRFSTSRELYNGRVIGLPGRHEASALLRRAAPYAAAWQPSKWVEEESRYPCEESAESDCMADGRFSVRASYAAASGERLPARFRDAHLGDYAGLFSLSAGDEPDLLLTVEDACALNGHYGVFGSASTELAYDVEIRDALDGSVRQYSSLTGPLIRDEKAFRCAEDSEAEAESAAPAAGPGALPGRELVAGGSDWRSGAPGADEADGSLAAVRHSWVGAVGDSPVRSVAASGAGRQGYCLESTSVDCQVDGRFEVSALVRNDPRRPHLWNSAGFRDALIGDNASLFKFFCVSYVAPDPGQSCTPYHPALLVEVVDDCSESGHYQVHGASASVQDYRVRIVDHAEGGKPVEYERSAEDPLILDRWAFPCSPLAPPSVREGTCEPGAGTLCLRNDRYAVEAEWWTAGGEAAGAKVVPQSTTDSGLFRFYDPGNWEILIKVLDGCSANGHHWVYGASTTDLGYSIRVTDTVTGLLREYRNEAGRPAAAITDSEAFPSACGERARASAVRSVEGSLGGGGAAFSFLPSASPGSGSGCVPGSESLCLLESRYEVAVEWSTLEGERGRASSVSGGTDNSGLFYFYDPGNWEILIKVLDGCSVNGHHWVYAASATDLGLSFRVTDTVTGSTWTYDKTAGPPAPAITASEAFPDGCRS